MSEARRRRPAIGAGLVLAFALFGLSVSTRADPVEVRAEPVPLNSSNPAEKRTGRLLYRGGLVLSADSQVFGGWSDLAVSADGAELLAISDQAQWLRARLAYDSNGDLSGLSEADVAPMLDAKGNPLKGRAGDAEGLSLERQNDVHGPAIVSFEGNTRVLRYDLGEGAEARPTQVPIGPWVKALRANEQLEAAVLVDPSTLLLIGEMKGRDGNDIPAALEAYPGGSTPATRLLSVAPRGPFAITGAANAPDGGIFLLERRFSLAGGIGMEIRHIAKSAIAEGARLDGEVIANLSFLEANIDNMEGITVRQGPQGETLIYVISDDNFLPIQRTLLLMFELRPPN